MRKQVGADRAREARREDLQKLPEEAREVGNVARHGHPHPKEPVAISNGHTGQIRGTCREKVTKLRKKLSPRYRLLFSGASQPVGEIRRTLDLALALTSHRGRVARDAEKRQASGQSRSD